MYLHSNVNSSPLFKWIKFPSLAHLGLMEGRVRLVQVMYPPQKAV